MKINWIITSTAVVTFAAAGAMAVSAQQGPPRSGERQTRGGGPTEAMLNACVQKEAAASCSVGNDDGTTTAGTCRAPEGRPLACVPEGAGPGAGPNGGGPGGAGGRPGGGPGGGPGEGTGGPPRGESNSGAKLSETQAYTAGVLCGYSVDALNEQVGLTSKAQWSCERGQRVLAGNGVPDHAVGQFPNPANPNTISEQSVSFTATTSPVLYSGPGGRVKEPVMGLNGIKFDPGTGGNCPDDVTDPAQCGLGPGSPGQWIIEALGQDSFDFGTDENHAHVQPGGSYHYHGVPDGMLSAEAKAGKEMAMIGWAADGFPVYARYGYPQANVMLGELALMRTSYRLKITPDEGRPSPDFVPMGAFAQDWEYVEGLGDLDECNGRFASTPEFPEGIYHYYATDAYPYVQRCVKGSIDSQPQVREGRERGGRGEGRRGGRGRGEEGNRGRRQ